MKNFTYLHSVGSLIDETTFEIYPASQNFGKLTKEIRGMRFKLEEEYVQDDPVSFEEVSNEWLENLSKKDLLRILKLMTNG